MKDYLRYLYETRPCHMMDRKFFDPENKPKFKQSLTHCFFPKHMGKAWVDVVEEDRKYIEWLLYESDLDISIDLYDKLEELLEDTDIL